MHPAIEKFLRESRKPFPVLKSSNVTRFDRLLLLVFEGLFVASIVAVIVWMVGRFV
jgi:hypothetical protein